MAADFLNSNTLAEFVLLSRNLTQISELIQVYDNITIQFSDVFSFQLEQLSPKEIGKIDWFDSPSDESPRVCIYKQYRELKLVGIF